ncbi:cytochrome P450 6A1-like [Culicoides brevitarsis]|uniref:cytochrome P450 6A1-like n=1 Tax=Culicoides brevitarsis TaxID=469753 RepID=UPI00307CC3E7
MFILKLLAVLLIGLFAIYLWVLRRFRYWKNLGVPCPAATFPYGTLQMGKVREHTSQSNARYYRQFKNKSPICGLFFTIKPAILALDINLIKNILIKDFSSFHDRGVYFNDRIDPLAGHIFNLEGKRWKTLRTKLTPTFSTGKMKYMFPTMVNVGKEFVQTLKNESTEVEMKELLARFTTDIIGRCAFGLECNSLKDPNAQFREMGKKVFEQPRNNRFKQFLVISYKEAGRFFNIKTVREDVSKFFMKVVKDTVEYREKNSIKQHDFMDLLINLKNSSNENERLSLNEIAAQAFVFFLAGFETSSTAMSYALYELAQNQDMQDKARKSVTDVLVKYNGEISYESVNEMSYIDHCINESLRKYPPGSNLIRECTKDYHIEKINYTIKKGMLIMIPVYAIHHDPEFYESPEVYMPERFEPEKAKQRDSITFIPFGEGPRICIGLRFGMLQAKIGLAMLLKSFRFSLSSKTEVPLVFNPKSLVLSPLNPLWLNLETLN